MNVRKLLGNNRNWSRPTPQKGHSDVSVAITTDEFAGRLAGFGWFASTFADGTPGATGRLPASTSSTMHKSVLSTKTSSSGPVLPPRRSRHYPSTDSGTIAEMDARLGPGRNDRFEEAIDDALSSLPADLRAAMSNVEIVVEDEPPDGQPLLGLYRGVPLPRRSSTYSGVLPDKISIFGGPITRLAAGDADRLRREVRHVVLHEIAHHFGISDERLIELDRY